MLKQNVACFDYMEPSRRVTYAYNRAHMQVCATVMQKFVA